MPLDKQFDEEVTLQRAMEAFWTRGFEATSMQDLVDCTGVNRASLYATYGDKRSFFLASLKRYDDNRKAILKELEAQNHPKESIRKLLLGFAENISMTSCNRGCFLTNTALELAAHDSHIGAIVARSQEDVEGFFLRAIKKGKAAGDIPPSVRPTEAARGLLASLIGIVVLSRSRPDKSLLSAVVSDAMQRLD